MKCSKCGGNASLRNVTRKVSTATGVVAGGWAAVHGLRLGAQVGTAICPGIGTAAGAILGLLTGAAAGGVAGNSVGKMLDESIIRQYQCENCGHTWRVE